MRALAIVLTLLGAVTIAAQEQGPFNDTIYVVRYGLDVRVTDSWGKAIDDLKPEDFTVMIDGKPATVESASWVALGLSAPSVESAEEDEPDDDMAEPEPIAPADTSRSIVLFIQTDFARVSMRVLGQMKFTLRIDDLLKPGTYSLKVRVNRRGATVQAPAFIVHGR